jgi:hypothetical protein
MNFPMQAINSFLVISALLYINDMAKICPNFGGCRYVKTQVVEPDDAKREATINAYCLHEETFKTCKRYITRKALWICPDFVLPDSDISEDEVADRYEKGEE